MKVLTTEGLIDRERLVATDIVTENENARAIATEWHLDGVLVRRDVAVSMFRGAESASEQGEFGG